jgi:excisionase family DNA binding protein
MQTEQVLFSLPLDRLEPIFKKWFNDVLISQASSTPTPPPPPPDPIRLFGDKAAAVHLGCSIMTVQQLRRNGSIPFIRTGRKLVYLSNELDEALSVKARKFQKSK